MEIDNQLVKAQKLKEAKQRYYNKHKEEISLKKKLYRENNKAIISERARKYYLNHLESEKARRQQTILCSCGKTFARSHASEHKKTKFHLENADD